MNCAHCNVKIPENAGPGAAQVHEVFLGNSAEVSTVCDVCYRDQSIVMGEVNHCERCGDTIHEDHTCYANEELCEDAPYADVPLCQHCYDLTVGEYGIDNYPDDPPEGPTGPSGAQAPPDKDYQMDA